MFQRSAGISATASRPSQMNFQKSSGLLRPPGKRHPMPMMAISSCRGSAGVGFLIRGTSPVDYRQASIFLQRKDADKRP